MNANKARRKSKYLEGISELEPVDATPKASGSKANRRKSKYLEGINEKLELSSSFHSKTIDSDSDSSSSSSSSSEKSSKKDGKTSQDKDNALKSFQNESHRDSQLKLIED